MDFENEKSWRKKENPFHEVQRKMWKGSVICDMFVFFFKYYLVLIQLMLYHRI